MSLVSASRAARSTALIEQKRCTKALSCEEAETADAFGIQ
jgi:hypothetical protein